MNIIHYNINPLFDLVEINSYKLQELALITNGGLVQFLITT
jgi:hypothetical protein